MSIIVRDYKDQSMEGGFSFTQDACEYALTYLPSNRVYLIEGSGVSTAAIIYQGKIWRTDETQDAIDKLILTTKELLEILEDVKTIG